ncbi:MAG: hypothetical protein V7711_01110 [Pseudomonadales bacterium]
MSDVDDDFIDDDVALDDNTVSIDSRLTKKESLELRRRVEERFELKRMQEELGDLDFADF